MGYNGPKWPKMAQNSPKWPKMAQNGPKWLNMNYLCQSLKIDALDFDKTC